MNSEVLLSIEGDVLRVISPEGFFLYETGETYAVHHPDTDEVIGWYRSGVTPPTGWAEVPRYGWRQFGRDVLLVGGFALLAGWILVQMLEELAR